MSDFVDSWQFRTALVGGFIAAVRFFRFFQPCKRGRQSLCAGRDQCGRWQRCGRLRLGRPRHRVRLEVAAAQTRSQSIGSPS